MKITVIADDFTGANDVGIQLNRYGLNTASVIDDIEESDVVVYDTETRNSSGEIAKKIVAEKFKEIKENGFDYFYKKIDSTLRGNIAEEIYAITENLNENEKIAVVPAFPLIGRVIKDGEHYLNGVKLVESEIAKDPISPVKEGNLKKIFNRSIHISAEEIKNGSAENKIRESNEKIVIFDSESEDELEECAKFIVRTGIDRYIAGSAGIMNYLPELWGAKNRVIIISGSCSTASIEQMEYFIDENFEEIDERRIDVKNRNSENQIYKMNRDIVVRSIVYRSDAEKVMKMFNEKGVSRKEAGNIISDYIAEESVKYITENSIKNIIILGGETSYKVLKKMEIKGLKIEFEIETGIAVAKTENMRYNIIVKPGNFGSKECIDKCYKILKNRKI